MATTTRTPLVKWADQMATRKGDVWHPGLSMSSAPRLHVDQRADIVRLSDGYALYLEYNWRLSGSKALPLIPWWADVGGTTGHPIYTLQFGEATEGGPDMDRAVAAWEAEAGAPLTLTPCYVEVGDSLARYLVTESGVPVLVDRVYLEALDLDAENARRWTFQQLASQCVRVRNEHDARTRAFIMPMQDQYRSAEWWPVHVDLGQRAVAVEDTTAS